jgi:hypothetical protein
MSVNSNGSDKKHSFKLNLNRAKLPHVGLALLGAMGELRQE